MPVALLDEAGEEVEWWGLEQQLLVQVQQEQLLVVVEVELLLEQELQQLGLLLAWRRLDQVGS